MAIPPWSWNGPSLRMTPPILTITLKIVDSNVRVTSVCAWFPMVLGQGGRRSQPAFDNVLLCMPTTAGLHSLRETAMTENVEKIGDLS